MHQRWGGVSRGNPFALSISDSMYITSRTILRYFTPELTTVDLVERLSIQTRTFNYCTVEVKVFLSKVPLILGLPHRLTSS